MVGGDWLQYKQVKSKRTYSRGQSESPLLSTWTVHVDLRVGVFLGFRLYYRNRSKGKFTISLSSATTAHTGKPRHVFLVFLAESSGHKEWHAFAVPLLSRNNGVFQGPWVFIEKWTSLCSSEESGFVQRLEGHRGGIEVKIDRALYINKVGDQLEGTEVPCLEEEVIQ